MTKPPDAVAGVSRILLDTNPVVYVIEKDATFANRTWAVINAARAAQIQLMVSPLTLMEVLSKPGMTQSELDRYGQFCLGTNEIHFQAIAFDDDFATRVGFLRRTTRVKMPDCIQFACAERLGCDAILTANADDYRRHPSVRCIDLKQIDLA